MLTVTLFWQSADVIPKYSNQSPATPKVRINLRPKTQLGVILTWLDLKHDLPKSAWSQGEHITSGGTSSWLPFLFVGGGLAGKFAPRPRLSKAHRPEAQAQLPEAHRGQHLGGA